MIQSSQIVSSDSYLYSFIFILLVILWNGIEPQLSFDPLPRSFFKDGTNAFEPLFFSWFDEHAFMAYVDV